MINDRVTTTNLELPAQRGTRRLPVALLAIPLLIIFLLLAAVLGYQWVNSDKIFPGVSVGSVPLGGKSKGEAAASLAVLNQQAQQAVTIKLTYDGKEKTISGTELGLNVDADTAVAEAIKVGRSGNFFADLGTQWQALNGGQSVGHTWHYDESRARLILADLHQEIDRSATSASLSISPAGKLERVPSQTGRNLDEQATVERLAAVITTPGPAVRTVAAVISEQSPPLTEQNWATAEEIAAKVLQPFTLSYPDRAVEQTLSTAEVAALVNIIPPTLDAPAQVTINQERVRSLLQTLADKVDIEANDARLQIDTTAATAMILPEQTGHVLDLDAAMQTINDNLTTDNRKVILPGKVSAPTVTSADLAPAQAQATSLLQTGFKLNYEGGPWNIVGVKMAVMLDIASGQNIKPAISFKQDVLKAKLQVISGLTALAPREGLYRIGADGRAFAALPPKPGREMDIAATAAEINRQLQAGSSAAPVAFKLTPAPTYDLSQPIAFPDTLASAVTSLKASSVDRAYNVTLGTNNFNETAIPPGGTYSASDAFGPIDEANGFHTGFAIVRNGANISTIPTVGGGICQVATTFFQTAWWTGLKVVERRGHMYWIGTYGRPPLGKLGLDATVYQYDTDLKVKNTTGNWLLVRSFVSKDQMVHFDLLGTKTGWKIVVSEPKVTKYVKSDQAMVYEAEPSWPLGKEVLVEHAQDGFDATISRQVYDANGKLLDTTTLNSHYEPAHNRTLVGTNGVKTLPANYGKPKAAATATPPPLPSTPVAPVAPAAAGGDLPALVTPAP